MKVAVVAKHKKRKKWPIVLLVMAILMVVSVVFPIAAIYIAFYDANTKKTNIDPDFTFENFANRVMVDSLDNAKEEKKMALKVTEEDMDNILAQALSKVNGTMNILKKGYMTIKGNKYDFYLDIDAKVLKTRVVIYTELNENEAKDTFIFSIENIKIGRISGLKGIGKTLMNQFLSEETITKIFDDMGLSIKFNSEDMTLSYKKDDILNDIIALTGSESGDNMFINVIKTVADQGLVDFDVNNNDFLDVNVNLDKLETNEYVTDTTSQIKIPADEVTTKVKVPLQKLVNEGKVNPDEDNLTYLYEYLFGGYDYIKSNEEKVTQVKKIDFSSIGIPNTDEGKEAYKGFDITSGENDLKEKMAASINVPAIIAGSKDLCSLNEDDINSYVAGRSVVGFTYLLHRRVDENEYKINYVTIDNFYCNIYNNDTKPTADFICKININGLHTSLVFNTAVPEEIHDDNKMTFLINDVRYGNIMANELKDTFFDIVYEALKGGDNSIQADKTNYSISFDFNSIIEDARKQTEDIIHTLPFPGASEWSGEEYFKGSNIDIRVVGDSKEVVGKLQLSLKEGISYLP